MTMNRGLRACKLVSFVLAAGLFATVSSGSFAQQSTSADLQQQVQQLRDDVRALQQDLRDLKQAAARRPSGWDKVDNLTLGPDGSPEQGSSKAPLVLFEFSDYQCPYCRHHFTDTFPQIERDFIATGKVRYVVGELPIPQLHPLALKAAEAARCARDQGKFWEMHAHLFGNQQNLEPWSKHAKAVGIDEAQFDACMSEGKYTKEIQRNASEALRAGIQSTPSFLLGVVDGDSVRIVSGLSGAAPYTAFKAEIDSLLTEATRSHAEVQ